MSPIPRNMLRRPVHLCAFGFGSGLLPVMPGTAGTLAAVPLYLLLASLPLWVYLSLVLLMFVLGVWLCGVTSRAMGVHDHGAIVWDEWVGYLVTMAGAPAGWKWVLLGFVLFRFFDMVKPWPVSWADRKVAGGLGIMLDDGIAGLLSLLTLQVVASLGLM